MLNQLISAWYIWALIIVVIIIRVFMPKIKGFLGEKSVSFFLSRLEPDKYKVINDLMLGSDAGTSQIDHVVVSNYGIFVIETKNYSGWIIGNEYDDYWTQVIYKRKEKLYNPLRQNYGHVEVLKECLKDYASVPYYPIVVFTIKADLKVKSASDVIYTVNLLKTIRKYTNEVISDEDKEKIYNYLLSININNKEVRKSHIQGIHEKKAKIQQDINDDLCPKCNGILVWRKGKYGDFKGCSNFPKCRYTLKT